MTAVEVACGQVEFGQPGRYDRLRNELEFVVARGAPTFPLTELLVMSVGILAEVLGVMLLIRWIRPKLVAF